jgi:hypothetical protein
MKKIIIAFSMVALFTTSSFAQEISGGAKAGLNFSNLTGEISDADMKIGYHLGGYVNIAFTEILSLQPELLFNAVGANVAGGDGKVNVNYISIPIMFKYSFGIVNVQAGPQIGVLMSAKQKFNGDERDIKDNFKSSDFGFNLGLGADFGLLNVAARYCIGLSSVDTDYDVKNSVFQLSLGIKLFGE